MVQSAFRVESIIGGRSGGKCRETGTESVFLGFRAPQTVLGRTSTGLGDSASPLVCVPGRMKAQRAGNGVNVFCLTGWAGNGVCSTQWDESSFHASPFHASPLWKRKKVSACLRRGRGF